MKRLIIGVQHLDKILSISTSHGDTRGFYYKDKSYTPSTSKTTFIKPYNSILIVTN